MSKRFHLNSNTPDQDLIDEIIESIEATEARLEEEHGVIPTHFYLEAYKDLMITKRSNNE